MSRPNIAGPTSARFGAEVFSCRTGVVFAVADFFSAVVLLIRVFRFGLTARIKAKTRVCFQPRVLVKIVRSTSPNGVANYGDDQNDNL
jgi:hypothetical protein